jgi:hypothetical protein
MNGSTISLSAAVVLMAGLVNVARADMVLIGSATPGVANQYPFGTNAVSTYQQVYSASLFSGPMTITAIDFFNTAFPAGSVNPATYTISLSTTSAAVNGLAPGAASSNIGANNTVFFSGTLGGAINTTTHELTITGGSFNYNPATGNLLMNISITNATAASGTVYLDSENGTFGTESSRSFNTDPTGSSGTENSWGLVTEFESGVTAAVPEPSSLTLFAIVFAVVGVCAYALRRRKSAGSIVS